LTEGEKALLERLDSFDAGTRRQALRDILGMVESGGISIPPVKAESNLHYHTFFSFNANGWSPSRIAWESLKYGLEISGIVDFDVLDGMDEFLDAGELLGLKTAAGLETRVFINELSDKVISSPNEPGVAYFMASGCYQHPKPGSRAEQILLSMRNTARDRNLAMVERINAYLNPVTLSYDADVTPLTPAGNATERHLLLAYDLKAKSVLGGDAAKVAAFWAVKLGITPDEASALIADTPKFHDKMRAKLMKYGGVGYIAPESGSFPAIEDAVRMIHGMGAIPTATWLDGTNPGEEDATAYLELLISKGVRAANIIPDRNWNIKDPEQKALKTRKLKEFIEACRHFNMPVIAGTEMNKAGLPFVDNFSAPELAPYADDFMTGARCIYGHTALARYASFGYLSEESMAAFGEDWKARNSFFAKAGAALQTEASIAQIMKEK
jgi:hypothetical protein